MQREIFSRVQYYTTKHYGRTLSFLPSSTTLLSWKPHSGLHRQLVYSYYRAYLSLETVDFICTYKVIHVYGRTQSSLGKLENAGLQKATAPLSCFKLSSMFPYTHSCCWWLKQIIVSMAWSFFAHLFFTGSHRRCLQEVKGIELGMQLGNMLVLR